MLTEVVVVFVTGISTRVNSVTEGATWYTEGVVTAPPIRCVAWNGRYGTKKREVIYFLWECEKRKPQFVIQECLEELLDYSVIFIRIVYKIHIVSWEPEGHYHYSMMFHWEPEGRYCCTKCMAIAPFWFTADDMIYWRVYCKVQIILYKLII